MSNQSQLISCTHCDASFQRREHFERHTRRHSGYKPFRCELCSKTFPRSDTLRRHKAIHERNAPRTKTNRNKRACLHCAKAKQRCEGGDPCTNCTRRGIVCAVNHDQQSSIPIPINYYTTPGSVTRSQSAALSAASTVREINSTAPAESPNMASLPIVSPPYENNLIDTESSLSVNQFPDSSDLDTGTYDLAWMKELYTSSHPLVWGFTDADMFSYSLGEESLGTRVGSEDVNVPSNEPVGLPPTNLPHGKAYRTNPGVRCLEFPEDHPNDSGIASTEVYGHVSIFPYDCFNEIQDFYLSQRNGNGRLIKKQIFHAFLELYFEHFDAQFPCIHYSTLETQQLSWILVLALASIGAQYSEMLHAPLYAKIFIDLLIEAVRSEMPIVGEKPKVSLVQSVFLRDVGLMFAGSARFQTILQLERSTIVILCHNLVSEVKEPQENPSSAGEWLKEEEIVRLLHCIYTLDCLEVIFLDLPSVFTLPHFTRRLPCPDQLWRSRDQSGWHEMRAETNSTPQSGLFVRHIRTIGAYIEKRTFFEHVRSLKLSKSLLASNQQEYIRELLSSSAKNLEISVQLEVTRLETNSDDPLLHVIGILQHIPLNTIYGCLGWRTSSEGIQLCRAKFAEFLRQKPSAARRCVWHAAVLFAKLRNARYFSCHDVLGFCVAANYIWSYDYFATHPTDGEIIRLDRSGPQVESWIQSGGKYRLNITGVGILDGVDGRSRLLKVGIKMLQSQVAWRSLSTGVAEIYGQFLCGTCPLFLAD